MLLIKNGRVLDPATKTDATLDVLIDGETDCQGWARAFAAERRGDISMRKD